MGLEYTHIHKGVHLCISNPDPNRTGVGLEYTHIHKGMHLCISNPDPNTEAEERHRQSALITECSVSKLVSCFLVCVDIVNLAMVHSRVYHALYKTSLNVEHTKLSCEEVAKYFGYPNVP